MPSLQLEIDPNYGYVVMAAATTFFLGFAHGINTGKYRRAAKVSYPAGYAPSSRTDFEAYSFNCAQRAHANYMEHHTSVVTALLLSGLKYPISAAVMGVSWSFFRFLYMRGYTNGKPQGKGRYNGGGYWLPEFGLFFLTTYVGASMVFNI